MVEKDTVELGFAGQLTATAKALFPEYLLLIDALQLFSRCRVYIIDHFREAADNAVIHALDDVALVMRADDSILHFRHQEEVVVFRDLLYAVVLGVGLPPPYFHTGLDDLLGLDLVNVQGCVRQRR